MVKYNYMRAKKVVYIGMTTHTPTSPPTPMLLARSIFGYSELDAPSPSSPVCHESR